MRLGVICTQVQGVESCTAHQIAAKNKVFEMLPGRGRLLVKKHCGLFGKNRRRLLSGIFDQIASLDFVIFIPR